MSETYTQNDVNKNSHCTKIMNLIRSFNTKSKTHNNETEVKNQNRFRPVNYDLYSKLKISNG